MQPHKLLLHSHQTNRMWTLLAMIAALIYAGFPLLSLAYVSSSTQYWQSESMPATVRLGGLSSSYNSVLGAMHDTTRWMKSERILNTTLNSTLTGFNSSSADGTPFNGIANQILWFPWADNRTVFTVSPSTAENKQLPLAGIRAFASCGFNNYSAENPVLDSDKDPPSISNLVYDKVDPGINGGFPYTLRCANNCSDLGNSSALSCSTQTSVVNILHFDNKDQSGYLDGGNKFTKHYSFRNVAPTFQGQVLSCVQQQYHNLQSVPTISLAVQDPNASTQGANCTMSVTYVRPTVNTLIGSYIESTGSTSTDIIPDAHPVELLSS